MRRGAAAALAACCLVLAGAAPAADRPQLDAARAAGLGVADYLAQGPAPWLPAPLPAEAHDGKPDFVVAADGSGTHRTVQAALDALPAAASGARRHVIHVRAGLYRELLCVRGKVPFLLVGAEGEAAAVRIVEGRYNALMPQGDRPAGNPCVPPAANGSAGTAGSATAVFIGDDISIAHLTIANDAMDRVRRGAGYPAGVGESGGAQAVALLLQGDRIRLHGVWLLGHQDTFYARAPAGGGAARVLVSDSLIVGDVDYVFGDATLVLQRCTLHNRGGRRTPGQGGIVLAPSTAAAQRLGFLVVDSRFSADPDLPAGSVAIGRAWDQGVPHGQWLAGASPNGQALVRDSAIGPHIGGWAASTARRPFAVDGPQANRLHGFNNRAVPARDLGREVLAAGDGWAAVDGTVRGGADAAPAHVFDVHDRDELAAALAPGRVPAGAPRIVRVRGRIDLDADAHGRPLGPGAWRDPGFDWDAYRRAYDPATWGRQPPSGPLEEARERSARRQAAQVVLKVPSRTTLVGLGGDAMIVHGMLLLDGVHDVIVRNLHFADAHDHFPGWDPRDGAHGEWNSDYDNLSLRRATRVWIAHNSFDDGARPDHLAPVWFGRRVQHHDGLLDITRASDFVTVAWNRFARHDKTSLVGGSDNHRDDAGHLRVSYHHNLWLDVQERAPRVRHGRVHVLNNLYVGRADGDFPYGYSIGVGLQSHIVSEANVFELQGVPPARIVRALKGETLVERGSLFNGAPLDLAAALREAGSPLRLLDEPGWTPPPAPRHPVADVARVVRAGAGAGRLW